MDRVISAASRRAQMDELDSWVLEELEALARDPRRPPRDEPELRRRPARPAPAADARAKAAGAFPEMPRAERGPAVVPPTAVPPYTGEDEARFIQQAAEWLQERPNADLILEQLWALVVAGDRPDAADGDIAGDGESDDVHDPEGRTVDEPPGG